MNEKKKDTKPLEYFINRCEFYEMMYLEQKEITAGYRNVVEDLKKEIERLKLKK